MEFTRAVMMKCVDGCGVAYGFILRLYSMNIR